jgi:hypothetical protein
MGVISFWSHGYAAASSSSLFRPTGTPSAPQLDEYELKPFRLFPGRVQVFLFNPDHHSLDELTMPFGQPVVVDAFETPPGDVFPTHFSIVVVVVVVVTFLHIGDLVKERLHLLPLPVIFAYAFGLMLLFVHFPTSFNQVSFPDVAIHLPAYFPYQPTLPSGTRLYSFPTFV